MAQFRLNARRALIGAIAGVAALTVSLSGQPIQRIPVPS